MAPTTSTPLPPIHQKIHGHNNPWTSWKMPSQQARLRTHRYVTPLIFTALIAHMLLFHPSPTCPPPRIGPPPPKHNVPSLIALIITLAISQTLLFPLSPPHPPPPPMPKQNLTNPIPPMLRPTLTTSILRGGAPWSSLQPNPKP